MKKIPYRHRTTFYQFLKTRLGDQISPKLLPRRLRILGHVAILWLDPRIEQYKKMVGEATLEYSSKIHSVLRRTAAIAGPYRKPAVELIAGAPETETVFRENKVIFHLDPMKVMFSVGNKAERLRMSKFGTDEFVIDMFGGIGQLCLPMAVHSKPEIIHAVEWNPDAFHYLKQNIQANNVFQILQPHFGDTRQLAPRIGKGQADRVIMGLIQGTNKYLKQGIRCIRPGGMMHIHEIGPKENMATELLSKLHKIALGMKRQADLVSTRTIKTYNPRYNHYVLDIELNNK